MDKKAVKEKSKGVGKGGLVIEAVVPEAKQQLYDEIKELLTGLHELDILLNVVNDEVELINMLSGDLADRLYRLGWRKGGA